MKNPRNNVWFDCDVFVFASFTRSCRCFFSGVPPNVRILKEIGGLNVCNFDMIFYSNMINLKKCEVFPDIGKQFGKMIGLDWIH